MNKKPQKTCRSIAVTSSDIRTGQDYHLVISKDIMKSIL